MGAPITQSYINFGMRGTGSFPTNADGSIDARQLDWQQTILLLEQNGDLSLTGLTSMLPASPTSDPEFRWQEEIKPDRNINVAGIFTSPDFSSAYQNGTGKEGNIVYLKIGSASPAGLAFAGQTVLLRSANTLGKDCAGRIEEVFANGANTRFTIRLLETPPTVAGRDIVDTNLVKITGSMFSEASGLPESKATDPVVYKNLTQIFMSAFSMSRTLTQTNIRWGSEEKRLQAGALREIGLQMEYSLLYGRYFDGVGANGMPMRSSRGLYKSIYDYSPNVDDYPSSAKVANGTTWLTGGEIWLDYWMSEIFKFQKGDKLGVCGNGVILSLNQIAKANGSYVLQPTMAAYGIKVVEFVSPFGTLYLKTHPNFTNDPFDTNTLMVFEPGLMTRREIQPLVFIDDTNIANKNIKVSGGHNWRDGFQKGYLAEVGWQLEGLQTAALLTGFGKNHS